MTCHERAHPFLIITLTADGRPYLMVAIGSLYQGGRIFW